MSKFNKCKDCGQRKIDPHDISSAWVTNSNSLCHHCARVRNPRSGSVRLASQGHVIAELKQIRESMVGVFRLSRQQKKKDLKLRIYRDRLRTVQAGGI